VNSTVYGLQPTLTLQICWSSPEKMGLTKRLENWGIQLRKVLLFKVSWHVMSS